MASGQTTVSKAKARFLHSILTCWPHLVQQVRSSQFMLLGFKSHPTGLTSCQALCDLLLLNASSDPHISRILHPQGSASWRQGTSMWASGATAAATAPAVACSPAGTSGHSLDLDKPLALHLEAYAARLGIHANAAGREHIMHWQQQCQRNGTRFRYHGAWEGGVRCGEGACEYVNGDIYQGEKTLEAGGAVHKV